MFYGLSPKGSVINKLIILPLAFLISAFIPQLIVPILLLGGAYLNYEGAEKIIEWLFPHAHLHNEKQQQVSLTPEQKKR